MMSVTLWLLLIIIGGILLMLWSGVAFIQDKKYFTSAPKDVQAAILPHEERFPGAHLLGWILMALSAVLMIGAVIFAIVDGLRQHYSFGQFFLRFLILLDGYKIWDMIFLDWYLLTKSHFYQHYFPEVAGCESLTHTGFNTKSQLLKLCIIFPLVSVLLAWFCTIMGGIFS